MTHIIVGEMTHIIVMSLLYNYHATSMKDYALVLTTCYRREGEKQTNLRCRQWALNLQPLDGMSSAYRVQSQHLLR